MLDANQLIELEVRAREELKALESAAASKNEEAEAVKPDNAIGRLSRLDSMQGQQLMKEAERRRAKRIERLKQSLEKMDTGTYGICEMCGEVIEYERLLAEAVATRCGKCSK